MDKKADKTTAVGVLQYVAGALIFIVCMITGMVTSFLMRESAVPTVFFISGIVVGTVLTCRGVINYKKAGGYRRVKKAMDGAGSIEIEQLSKKIGWPKEKVSKSLKSQIDFGFWPDSHFDNEKGVFMLAYNPAHLEADTGNEATDEVLKEANKHLHDMAISIRGITNEEIKDKAEKIVDIAKQIYKTVEENPEKQSGVRQLTNYFLPTTAKLLRDYAELQNQQVKSDNMEESMQKIVDAMPAIEETMKKQQEAIFNDKAMDISVEIDVMKKMMR